MYCTKCGNKLSTNDKFCTECGHENMEYNTIKVNNNSDSNLFLVFSVIAVVLFWVPIVSIPISIINMVKSKNSSSRNVVIPLGVVSIVLSVLFTIIVVGVVLFTYMIADSELDDVDINWDDYVDEFYDYDEDNYFDIKGYSWLGSDKSVLYLENDMSYVWYLDDSNHSDNYTSGNYYVYMGEEALRYISDRLPEYGITEEKQRELFRRGDYDIEDYYLLILNCTKVYKDGASQENSVGEVPYYGFYDDDRKQLDLVNMKTGNTAKFYFNSKIDSANDSSSL